MPVTVPSIRGQVPYDVETAINSLVTAVNQLEGSISPAALLALKKQVAEIGHGLNVLTQRFDDLYRQVQVLNQQP